MITADKIAAFDTVMRAKGWIDDELYAVVHGTGDESAPVGILGAKPKPRPCQVACPYCRARQDAKGHPARCDECGWLFGKTAPIRRRGLR